MCENREPESQRQPGQKRHAPYGSAGKARAKKCE